MPGKYRCAEFTDMRISINELEKWSNKNMYEEKVVLCGANSYEKKYYLNPVSYTHLPVCNQEPIAFTDALFTSTSAVCVTGLMTVVPAAQFTLLGKVVLLVLIQIGGLGVVAVSTFFLVVIGRKITVKELSLIHI